MANRSFSTLDRLLGEIDKAIKVLAAPAHANRSPVSAVGGELVLEEAERTQSGRLMRVNHAGEVAAQALYNGQALTARDPKIAAAMHRAAAEEMDHLAWCEQRLKELGARTSLLNPLWYAGSFAIGALAGAIGDRAGGTPARSHGASARRRSAQPSHRGTNDPRGGHAWSRGHCHGS